MKILIGSKAITFWFPDFTRSPKDTDYAVKDKKTSTREIENLVNPVLFKDKYAYALFHSSLYDETIAMPDVLYTLKMSHIFWDINWEKHRYDIGFLRKKGCELIPELFHDLYEYWSGYHGQNKRSDLKMTSEDFFNNALRCPYEHDYLHTLLVNPPTYTKVLCDGAEVEVCEDKFKSLTYEQKLSLVREEIYVMAWERMSNIDYRKAYGWMLKKFIISHAPIWEAIFIMENMDELYKPHINYQKIINEQLNLETQCN